MKEGKKNICIWKELGVIVGGGAQRRGKIFGKGAGVTGRDLKGG